MTFTAYIKENIVLLLVIGIALILSSMFTKLLQAAGIVLIILVGIVYLIDATRAKKKKK